MKTFTPPKNLLQALCLSAVFSMASFSWANDKITNQPQAFVSSDSSINFEDSINSSSTPNSSVTLDFSLKSGESWDTKGKAINMVENCVQGDAITGLEWNNVQLQTVGDSFLSEATIKFSDSSGSGGIELSVGFGSEFSGSSPFSSDGIFDLTDNFVSDVTSNNDKKFLLEFFELVDDADNQIDAHYLSGTVTVWGTNLLPVPTCPFISSGVENSDLNIEISASDSTIKLRDEITVEVIVRNTGSGDGSDIDAILDFPSNLEYLSNSCSDGTIATLQDSMLSLQMQDIPDGSSTACDIVFKVVRYGPIKFSASVESATDDNASNNNGSLELRGAVQIIPTLSFWSLLILCLIIFSIAFLRNQKSSS